MNAVVILKWPDSDMSISPLWAKHEPDMGRWCVAQVLAPLDRVISTLSRSRVYRDSKQDGASGRFVMEVEDWAPIIAYTLPTSSWTFLEPLYGHMGDDLCGVTKALRTSALFAGFEDNNASGGIIYYRNGTIVEEYFEGDPECHERAVEDCFRDGWIATNSTCKRFFTKRKIECDIDKTNFLERWGSVSDYLELEVPFRYWTKWKDENTVTLTAAGKRLSIVSARLLYTYSSG